MDEAAAQLHGDLKRSIATAHLAGRPILTHLNADTTWLLRIPYPPQSEPPCGRCRFNVLVDPWLKGPQTDVAGWFSTQWHAIKSSVQTVAELDELLREAEELELEINDHDRNGRSARPSKSYVDLVVVSHEFTDHCHRSTLLEVDSRVPVFATTKAVGLIKSWSHFETVVEMPLFAEHCDWRTTSLMPLPRWLGVSRLVTESDALHFHSAVIICIQESGLDSAEAVIYTPHGVHAATCSTLKSAHPSVSTLAFLHGLHDVSIALTKQLNLGAHNALKAQRLLQAKYWVGTHDEVKTGKGIVASFLRRKTYTFLDALAGEATEKVVDMDREKSQPKVSYADLGSGESLLLL